MPDNVEYAVRPVFCDVAEMFWACSFNTNKQITENISLSSINWIFTAWHEASLYPRSVFFIGKAGNPASAGAVAAAAGCQVCVDLLASLWHHIRPTHLGRTEQAERVGWQSGRQPVPQVDTPESRPNRRPGKWPNKLSTLSTISREVNTVYVRMYLYPWMHFMGFRTNPMLNHVFWNKICYGDTY